RATRRWAVGIDACLALAAETKLRFFVRCRCDLLSVGVALRPRGTNPPENRVKLSISEARAWSWGKQPKPPSCWQSRIPRALGRVSRLPSLPGRGAPTSATSRGRQGRHGEESRHCSTSACRSL